MVGIYCGSHLVVYVKTLGGGREYDIVVVTGGHGTVTEPWKVKSTVTSKTFTVSAMEIVKDSYRYNYSGAEAEAIYTSMASRPAPELHRPIITPAFDVDPF